MAPNGFTRVDNPDMPVDVPYSKGCIDLHIMARWSLNTEYSDTLDFLLVEFRVFGDLPCQ